MPIDSELVMVQRHESLVDQTTAAVSIAVLCHTDVTASVQAKALVDEALRLSGRLHAPRLRKQQANPLPGAVTDRMHRHRAAKSGHG